jgi:hypothetical protein
MNANVEARHYERAIKRLKRALLAMERCPGIDSTDQKTGKTFRDLIIAATEQSASKEKGT